MIIVICISGIGYLLTLLLNAIILRNAYENFLMNDGYYELNDIELDVFAIVKNQLFILKKYIQILFKGIIQVSLLFILAIIF